MKEYNIYVKCTICGSKHDFMERRQDFNFDDTHNCSHNIVGQAPHDFWRGNVCHTCNGIDCIIVSRIHLYNSTDQSESDILQEKQVKLNKPSLLYKALWEIGFRK